MPEPLQRVLGATAVAESLSFCMERKYLRDIDTHNNSDGNFSLKIMPNGDVREIKWIRINQVGRSLANAIESSFTAMQKILQACFLPDETQLVFLIVGGNKGNGMYLGLRSIGKNDMTKSHVVNLEHFIHGIWPGMQTEVLKTDDENIKSHIDNIAHDRYQGIYSLTGIPSIEDQYKQTFPATTDKLMAGMDGCDSYAYMVVATPVSPTEVDNMLCKCREMNGQAESLKSANLTEGITEGSSVTIGLSQSESDSISRQKYNVLGKAVLGASGLGIASTIFPVAKSVLNGCANATGAIVQAGMNIGLELVGLGSIANFVSSLMPTATHSTSVSHSQSESRSESRSNSISRNVVNKHIERAAEHLAFHADRLEKGKAIGVWNVGVYLMADQEHSLQSGAMHLKSLLSGNDSVFEPIRCHNISDLLIDDSTRNASLGRFQIPNIIVSGCSGRVFEHPLGEYYTQLTSVLTTKELSNIINFPLRTVPGISVIDSSPEFSLSQPTNEGMNFGKLLYGGGMTNIEYNIPTALLSRHVLISGINGSGKTNTIKAFLNSISNLPFLVIEPAKTEYVDWAIEHNMNHPNSPVDIYIPGCKSYKGYTGLKKLKLNPFEIVWLDKDREPNVLTHIDRLKSTFASAFPMYDILPVLMEDLIYSLYSEPTTNWMGNPEYGKTMFPTLNTMKMCVDKVIEHHKYEERVSRNMKACLNTRIDSLMRGWKGEMLNIVHSTPWEDLFAKPAVINLSYVGDDVDKGFFMSLILQFLYEYRCALSEADTLQNDDCRHLTVIEEAHRVMSKCDNPELPQYKTATMFSNMLSEIRAYGEGFMLVDQVPTRLIPDAIKNTNLKITHRLVAEDDCRAISESMGLNQEQRVIIPKLLTGQCIVSSSKTTDVYWVKVNKSDNIK